MLIKKGMQPSQLTVEEEGKLTEAIIFPWAEINYQEKTKIVSLLPTSVLVSQEEQLQKAIESLEYLFSDAINSICCCCLLSSSLIALKRSGSVLDKLSSKNPLY